MKLLGSTESKITKDKNGENVPHLEVVALVLAHATLLLMISGRFNNIAYFCTKQVIW